MARIPKARYVLLPITPETRGHGTHTLPVVWRSHLAAFLAERAGTGAADASSPEADDLKALEQRLVTAIAARDLATYDALVAPDYVVVEAAGTVRTKADVMASNGRRSRR